MEISILIPKKIGLTDVSVVSSLWKVFRKLKTSEEPFEPQDILNKLSTISPELVIGEQQEVDDFLQLLSIKINEEEWKYKNGTDFPIKLPELATEMKNLTALNQIFGIILEGKKECFGCDRQFTSKAYYATHILLEIVENATVQTMLNTYFEEKLENFPCEKSEHCNIGINKESFGMIQQQIVEMPDVLKLVLNRFTSNSLQRRNEQVIVNECVQINGVEFSLIAMIKHKGGRSTGTGHYLTIVKKPDGYYEFDDEFVQKVGNGLSPLE